MDFGYLHLSPPCPCFAERYPDLKLEVECSDRRVALVEEGSIWPCASAACRTPPLVAKPLCHDEDGGVRQPRLPGPPGQAGKTPRISRQHDCLIYTPDPAGLGLQTMGGVQHSPQGLRANNNAGWL